MSNTQNSSPDQESLAQDVAPNAAPSPLHIALREKVAGVIRNETGCGLSISFTEDWEHVFCDDPRLGPQFYRSRCECKTSADAAITATIEALIELELPEPVTEAGCAAIASTQLGFTGSTLAKIEFRAILREIRALINKGGE
jgi:hypothetical protein